MRVMTLIGIKIVMDASSFVKNVERLITMSERGSRNVIPPQRGCSLMRLLRASSSCHVRIVAEQCQHQASVRMCCSDDL